MGNSWKLEIGNDAEEGDILYVVDDPAGTAVKLAQITTNAPTGIHPNTWQGTAIYGYPSATVAQPEGSVRQLRFCQACGNPVVEGKLIRREHDVETGLMTYKWHMAACYKIRHYAKHPWLVRFRYLLRKKWFETHHELHIKRYTSNLEGGKHTWDYDDAQRMFHWWKARPDARLY
jgi:hypothetical protein